MRLKSDQQPGQMWGCTNRLEHRSAGYVEGVRSFVLITQHVILSNFITAAGNAV